ncbi:ATP synthase subunit I [Cyanobium sp. ATX 6A2]|uniref:ATP synthase subunit I n=1 Tax=Cyanobium sp. ATX 6A2 TaxID=2823700 RepID=UPI0020CDB22B|nr:ATP synthase subunit I [Cyanobium sp. ATX 6A2]
MQASTAATTDAATPDAIGIPANDTDCINPDAIGDLVAGKGSAMAAGDALDDYARLQRRLLLATLLVTLVASVICWLLFGPLAARSLFLGGSCGLLYLRLLARSVGRIGPESRSLGRFQILVPALLVVAAAKLPGIAILPALAGFVLYKPALLLQAFIAP